MMLARLARMMGGVGGVTVRRMGMVRGLFVAIRLVVLGGFAMVFGCVLVMLRRGVVMFDNLVFGHDALVRWAAAADQSPDTNCRKAMLHVHERERRNIR
jgi:hypothetical protein